MELDLTSLGWGEIFGIVAALGTIVAAGVNILKHRVDRTDRLVTIMEKTVTRLEKNLETAERAHERQSNRIDTLDRRFTHLATKNDIALVHIWARESWAQRRWPNNRPSTLPQIPVEIAGDVQKIALQMEHEPQGKMPTWRPPADE